MNTNQPKVICRQFTTAQLDTLVVGEIGYNVTLSKYVGRNADGRITYIEAQATTELELPEGTAEAPYLEWNGSAWVAVSNPTILENGSATALYLVWNNSEGKWESKTTIELLNILLPEGTPVNAKPATATIAATGILEEGKTISIRNKNYRCVSVLESAYDYLLELTASATLDNLIVAINGGAGAGTKYGIGTEVNSDVSALAGDRDTIVLTARVKGGDGNSITLETADIRIDFGNGGGVAGFLTGGVDGTIGTKGEMYKDTSYMYIAIADNTIADTNWRRIALGTAY